MTDLEPRPDEEEIAEPEVIRPGERPKPRPPEFQPKAPLFFRAIAAVAIAGAGVISLAVGLVLTISIVGAWIGVPLLALGLALLAVALAVLIGGGKFTIRRF